jgi:hypothetical protein
VVVRIHPPTQFFNLNTFKYDKRDFFMTKGKEIKARIEFLKLQRLKLLRRWEREKRRRAFIKKNIKKIMALKTTGWPRLKDMPDRYKWIDLVYEAKIAGIYGIGTANCDVVAQLERFAKEPLKEKSA